MTANPTDEVFVQRSIEDELKESYLRYSMSVIVSRALPDVRDGLKPSQRRILYAMKLLNLGAQSKHRKCAKICGDTSGDFHPHGESVIYPTLVRMAQNWAMRYCLVNGQGNFGSIDGDPPAQMRYTEARLTPASVHLMDDLDKDTVDFVPNYDETKKEPLVFPSKFPNLLCNGSSGIAVGMATTIPPHNLGEVIKATLMLLDNPASSTDRQRIVISEIPYNVNKSRLIEQIAHHIQEKTITGISDLRDESDRQGLRVVIELKKGEVAEVILNQLYKFSDLETTFGCQMLALDKGLPRLLNIKQMMGAWIDHRIDVVRRRTRFELKQAEARAHILAGYLKAIDHLDEVVALIRASSSKEEAKKELIRRFEFSERQAGAILDLRLYQLTALEHNKIETEYKALLEKIADLKAILASEDRVKGIITDELSTILRHYGEARRTKITHAESDVDIEDLIPNEQVAITISKDDYIKRMPIDIFREQRRGGQGITGIELKKEDDAIKGVYVLSTHDYMLIFTNFGRCYWLKVWQIPETGRRSKGRPLVNLLGEMMPGERIATLIQVDSFDTDDCVLMSTKAGVVKKTSLRDFSNPRRKGIISLSIDEGDELIGAQRVSLGQEIMLFTRQGMAVRFEEDQVRQMGRTARGVRGVSLKKDGDGVVGCEVVNGDEALLVVCENGFGKRSPVQDFRKTRRGGVGVKSIITSERNGAVIAGLCMTDEDGIIMISSTGQTIRIAMKHVRVMGRNTQGVRLANLKTGYLVAVQRIRSPEGVENGDGEEVVEGVKEEQVEE